MRCVVFLLFGLLVMSALPVLAAGPAQPATAVASVTGLPLPRFVSIRAEPVNVRSGPGERYPVLWVLKKRGMPVQVIAEYENWRKIRDWMGTEGWVHQAMVNSRRSVVIHPEDAVLRVDPNGIARPLARVEAGVIAEIEKCEAAWCRIEIGQMAGWVDKHALWGVDIGEVIEK
jgi:SH3-like domain-containing protein